MTQLSAFQQTLQELWEVILTATTISLIAGSLEFSPPLQLKV